MKSLKRATALILSCSALAGCQTMGNGRALSMDEVALTQSLKPNRSTKAEVEREFGPARVYRFANGFETWAYQKTEGIPRYVDYLPVVGAFTQLLNDRVTEVAFLFDPQGILRNIDRREFQGASSSTGGHGSDR